MIKMPLNDIIAKIKDKAGISEEEINSRIQNKTEQLSGLISQEGAAHIIANELGIKLFEEVSGKLQIKNILEGMRSVETVGRVQHISDVTVFQRKDGGSGKVGNLAIGDETGAIRVVLWGSQADKLSELKEGDIVKVLDGYVRLNNNAKEIHLNEKSKLVINPEGEAVGEVKEAVNERKSIKDLNEKDGDVEIFGTIVQAFEPRFFEVCPQCNKRARQRDEEFYCEEHSRIKPDYSYVMNAVLDDGTETIRTVFFRSQAERLLKKSREDIMKYKDNPVDFDAVKTQLLGEQVKIVGRVKNNELFNRMEFVSRLVFTDVDPKEEVARLEKEVKAMPKARETIAKKEGKVEEIDEGLERLPSVEEI